MAIARRVGATVTNNGNSPLTVSKPPNIVQADLMVTIIVSGTAIVVTAPTGWSQSNLGNVAASSLFTQLWWKLAGPSEPSSYTWNWTNPSTPGQFFTGGWLGCDLSQPIDVAFTHANGTTTPDAAAAITYGAANAWVLTFLSSVNNIHWTAPVTTPVTNLFLSTSGGLDIFDSGPEVSSPVAARTFTPSGTSGVWIANSVALRPATAGGGGSHTVTGVGSFAITSPVAISVTLTGIPGSASLSQGNPNRYNKLGSIAWATPNGAIRQYFLSMAIELIIAPISDATTLYYSLAPGMTAVIQELSTP